MKKYELSIIGAFHTNHNEDSSVVTEFGENQILIAVMDGCSMGTESHFASTLIAKILRKVGKAINYREFAERREKTAKEYLKEIMGRLFQELRQIKNQLLLELEEVLSTLILGVLNKKEKEIELITIGDGLICCNGELYEYEQDNQPDYLGYHLNEAFDDWFSRQKQRLSLENVNDLSISTDGVFTFKKFDNKTYEKMKDEEIIDYFLVDRKDDDKENMLGKKLLEIERRFGLKPSDDLTIVKMIFG